MDEDKVRQILQSLELKARETGRSLNSVRAQVGAKEREKRIAEITISEIDSLPEETKLYQGVGKMFVQEDSATIKKSLRAERKEASDTLLALQKKQKFLENELETTNKSVRSIFGRQ